MEDSLYGLVDDAETNGQDVAVGVVVLNESEKLAGSFFQLGQRLYIVWPRFVLDVWDEHPREVAPVALAQQGGGDNLKAMRLGNDGGCLYGTVEIAGDNCINAHVLHLPLHCLGLPNACRIQFSLCLPLHDLAGIVVGFAVANQIDSGHKSCVCVYRFLNTS